MSQEPPAKRARRSARSCVECRHRKSRCVWPSEGADTCSNCLARGRRCVLQVLMTPTSDVIKLSSRARIEQLEQEVASLWSAVRDLHSKTAHTPAPAAFSQPLLEAEDSLRDESLRDESLRDDSSDGRSDRNSTTSSIADPPTHLQQLFDNDLLGSGSYIATDPSHRMRSKAESQKRAVLRKLMPSREDMITITAHASSWLILFHSTFPLTSVTRTSEETLSRYDKLQHPDADVLELVSLLLTAAVTIQQEPEKITANTIPSVKDTSSFVERVSDAVESIVVNNDAVGEHLDGFEAMLLFLRLQLSHAPVKQIALLIRRIIALAELAGLPRAARTIASSQGSSSSTPQSGQAQANPSHFRRLLRKDELWTSICTIDRMFSTMWSLPLATARYSLPKLSIMDPQGSVSSQAYLYSLADIASRILDMDDLYVSRKVPAESINMVMGIDQELRTLASMAPNTWWKVETSELMIDTLLQYWHKYLFIRTHLSLAVSSDESQQFPFNFYTCLDACQELVRRYMSIRLVFPPGFFAIRIIDLQAFTAVVFLLLTSYRYPASSDRTLYAVNNDSVTSLVEDAIRMMQSAASRPKGDFARQAVEAICRLRSLLQHPQASKSQKIVLDLPLFGKLHVARKSSATKSRTTQPSPDQLSQVRQVQNQTFEPASTEHTLPLELSPLDSLYYSIEVPEDYAFLTDDLIGNEQWLTWTG